LDFAGFRRFVKLLKARPEVDKLFQKLSHGNGGRFDFSVFEKFIRDEQKVSEIFSTLFFL
jgi:phosphatidylinositol phospholipase C delta